MKALVTGGTGFVGKALVLRLVREGHEVHLPLRRQAVLSLPHVTYEQFGEIDGDADWGTRLDGVDSVFHLAAHVHQMEKSKASDLAFRRINVEGTEKLAQAAASAGVRRFVFLSSVKVNGEKTTGESFRESDVPAPEDDYGRTKWEAEQLLREIGRRSGMEITIIRSPLVYGPGVKANFLRLIEMVDRRVPLPFGLANNRRSLVYVGNLVDALAIAGSRLEAARETFFVSDGRDVSTAELIRKIAEALGTRPRMLMVPPFILGAGAALFNQEALAQRLLGSLTVDISKIRRELGWSPPFTLEQGLAETAAWYRSR